MIYLTEKKTEIRRMPLIAMAFFVCCLPMPAETPQFDMNWTWVETPWGKPVIDRGAEGEWDFYAVDNPYVYAENGKYYCFFEAQDAPFPQNGHERFSVAVSDDGIHWQKTGKPLLDVGMPGRWDSALAKLPTGVLKIGDTYYIFYSGNNNKTKQIGLATSKSLTDGWEKASSNPVIPSRPKNWDKWISTYPSPVFEKEGKYYLLYRGMEGLYYKQGVGLAVSEDLLNWRRVSEAEEGPLTPLSEEIASLAVAKINDHYIGISQPMDITQRRYWLSDNLIKWEKGPKVKIESSGAASTLSNPFVVDGCWNIVYEQDDRIYCAVLTPPSKEVTKQ